MILASANAAISPGGMALGGWRTGRRRKDMVSSCGSVWGRIAPPPDGEFVGGGVGPLKTMTVTATGSVLARWRDDESAAGRTMVLARWRDNEAAVTTVLARWRDDESAATTVLARWRDDESAAGRTTVLARWRDDESAAGRTMVLARWRDDESAARQKARGSPPACNH
jgi:hypothetical protein